MRRSRTTSALLGLVVVLVNISIVVAVVSLTGWGRGDTAPPTAGAPTGTPTPGASTSTTGAGSAAASATDPTAQAARVAGLLGSGTDVSIAVLGDGTGDEKGEWVQVLAERLGSTHEVALRNLDPSDPTRYSKAVTYGSSGPTATVWNGSRGGVSASYAARRLGFLIPSKPDVVLLNYGRDNTASNMPPAISATYAALRKAWPDVPVMLVLQPPDRDDAIGPVRVAAEDWAASHGVPTIDVAAAFDDAGDPNDYVSVVDPPSVNSKGGRLWARTVLDALGADVSGLPDDGSQPGGGSSGGTSGTASPSDTPTTSGG